MDEEWTSVKIGLISLIFFILMVAMTGYVKGVIEGLIFLLLYLGFAITYLLMWRIDTESEGYYYFGLIFSQLLFLLLSKFLTLDRILMGMFYVVLLFIVAIIIKKAWNLNDFVYGMFGGISLLYLLVSVIHGAISIFTYIFFATIIVLVSEFCYRKIKA